LRALKRTNLSEQLMVQLAELIREGEFRPGDRLPSERDLAQRMSVSRATVREGLRVMASHGLVAIRPGAGTFIAEGSPEALALALSHIAVREVFELRQLLEPSICYLAAERATPEDLAKLDSILNEQRRQVELGHPGASEDGSFHRALAEATHNRAILRLGSALIDVLALSRDPRYQTPQRALTSLTSHEHIIEAVKAHAPRRARQFMEEHIRLIESTLFEPPGESPIPAAVGSSLPLDASPIRYLDSEITKVADIA
jgi:GntR family transcriptional repressor for pyruvate dehydrogenase complex